MQRQAVLQWLRAPEDRLDELWAAADECRRAHVGDAVHLRGLVEISSYCARNCHYCGLRADNHQARRYRLTVAEIMHAARQCVALGYGTIVLQAGEDYGLTQNWIADLIRLIKHDTGLAVTLSLGERRPEELRVWRSAGADRYLLRFETSNAALYARLHPAARTPRPDRLALLPMLRELGYEVGSGALVGLPGQTHEDLANDLLLLGELDLDMIGVGPFIPHPDTPLGVAPCDAEDQVRADELTTYRALALARLICPDANIPATTALATLNRAEGRLLGLQRGANVVMPNLTPAAQREDYAIYPDKACTHEDPTAYDAELRAQLSALGRSVGKGRGDSLRWRQRHANRRRDDYQEAS